MHCPVMDRSITNEKTNNMFKYIRSLLKMKLNRYGLKKVNNWRRLQVYNIKSK